MCYIGKPIKAAPINTQQRLHPLFAFHKFCTNPNTFNWEKRPQTIMSLSLLTLDTNEESVNTRFPFVEELSDILCDVLG